MTEEQYQRRLDAVLALMRCEPEPGTLFANLLDALIEEVLEYEKAYWGPEQPTDRPCHTGC